MKNFGNQIAEARKRYGISQVAIARLIGRSQWFVSAVERGKVTLTETAANRILLAIHGAGEQVRAMTLPTWKLKDLRLGPRSNSRIFKNLKT